MRPGKIAGHIRAKLCVAWRCFKRDVLRMQPSDLNEIARNQVQVSGQVVPEAQEIPRHGFRDPLQDRFRHMIEF